MDMRARLQNNSLAWQPSKRGVTTGIAGSLAAACALTVAQFAGIGAALAADLVPALGSAKSLMVRAEPLSMPEVLTTRSLQTNQTSMRSVVVSDVAAAYEPLLMPVHHSKDAPNACKMDSASLCYDYRTGKAIYKPSKEWVPPIAGLKSEGLSAKRDKVTFLYSFK
jgi:hypothetical protein